MNERTLLEKEIAKSVSVREKIAKILLDNYPIEKDFADIIAFEAANNAIGTERLEKYNEEKALSKAKQEKELAAKERSKVIASIIEWCKTIFVWGGSAFITLVVLFYFVTGVHSCITKSPYPRTYNPLPERARFVNVERSGWTGDIVPGLSNDSNLCIEGNRTKRDRGDEGSYITCMHPNKAEGANQALEDAVINDKNGVIWEAPNGNGEVWKIERNNYRFVITATKDEGFKE